MSGERALPGHSPPAVPPPAGRQAPGCMPERAPRLEAARRRTEGPAGRATAPVAKGRRPGARGQWPLPRAGLRPPALGSPGRPGQRIQCVAGRGDQSRTTTDRVGTRPGSASCWRSSTSALVVGYRAVIEAEPDLVVVGVAEDRDHLADDLARTAADVVITECRPFAAPLSCAFEIIERLRAAAPGPDPGARVSRRKRAVQPRPAGRRRRVPRAWHRAVRDRRSARSAGVRPTCHRRS